MPETLPATYVTLDAGIYDPTCEKAYQQIMGGDDMKVVTEKLVCHIKLANTAISKKQNQIYNAVENNIATWDNVGNTKDSKKSFDTSSDFSSATDNQIKTAAAIKSYVTNIVPQNINDALATRFYMYIKSISVPTLTASILNIGSGTATIFGGLSISSNKITLSTPQIAKRFLLDITLNITLSIALTNVIFTITGTNCIVITQPRTITLLSTQDIRLTAIITIPASVSTASQFWVAVSGTNITGSINNQSSLTLTEI